MKIRTLAAILATAGGVAMLVILTITLLILSGSFLSPAMAQAPLMSRPYYDNITQNGVTLHWNTDLPADTRVHWMVSDSNYQPVAFTDSLIITGPVTGHSVTVGNLQPATMYRFRAASRNTGGEAADTGYFITQSASSGAISVYFNHSVDTTVSAGEKANGNSNFLGLLKERIDKASHSIDLTSWEFSGLDSAAAYLVRAHERGVKIRFVYNHMPDNPNIETLRAHGIPILKREFDTTFTMHNKFWIFDHRYNTGTQNQYLWTGSTNITHTQFHSDRNNIIVIQDQSLCEVYTREFEEMWGSHTDLPDTARSRFGTEKTDNLAHRLNVSGIPMEVYFAPTDSIADTLALMMTARPVKSIYFCMLKFTLPNVEDSLHSAFLRGIRVSGVFDSSCSVNAGSAYPRMKGHPVPGAWQPPADVYIDAIPGLLHHKYMLVDADTAGVLRITTTGSFNWEIPAQRGNDENMIVVHNDRVNNLYFQEFMARYRESGGVLVGGGIGASPPGTATDPGRVVCLPNPFGDQAELRFMLGATAHVTIDILDATGQKVYTAADQVMIRGEQRVVIDGRRLPGGLLLGRVRAGNGWQVVKLLHREGVR